MSHCCFLLIVIVAATMLIYKELFKNTRMSRMLLITGFIKLLILCIFSKVVQCNTEVNNQFMVIKKD